MSWSTEANQIQAGDDVFGSDGDKVGSIAGIHGNYLVVEKGFFFPTDYYIPISAVASVGDGQVYLNVTKDAALHSGWDTVPDASAGTATGSQELLTDVNLAGADRGSLGDRAEVAGYEVTAEDELRIPVLEEELTATVRPTEAGAVRIEKHVIEEDRVLDVPVTDEQIRVERRIVDRPVEAADPQAFEEIVIEVPLTREEVELHKQARVVEEVVIDKEAVQRTEQVHGTVRREEVTVNEDAALLDQEDGRSVHP